MGSDIVGFDRHVRYSGLRNLAVAAHRVSELAQGLAALHVEPRPDEPVCDRAVRPTLRRGCVLVSGRCDSVGLTVPELAVWIAERGHWSLQQPLERFLRSNQLIAEPVA